MRLCLSTLCFALWLALLIIGTPAPHVTTWAGRAAPQITFSAKVVRDAYRQNCKAPGGGACNACTDVSFGAASVSPPKKRLQDIPAWAAVNGVWYGELTYSAPPDPDFPGNYSSYYGIILRKAVGHAYHQKNIFFYPGMGTASTAKCDANCDDGMVQGKKLSFGYGYFQCYKRQKPNGAGLPMIEATAGGAIKIFATVTSEQADEAGSLRPPAAGTPRNCSDANQYTNVLGDSTGLAAMACGVATTHYSHNQAILVEGKKMFRSWIDTKGSHSYYKEQKLGPYDKMEDLDVSDIPALGASSKTDITNVALTLMEKVQIGTTESHRRKLLSVIVGGDLATWLARDDSTAPHACEAGSKCINLAHI